ncbi:MAG: uracil-DNA glycosylase [Lysobacterales bacterium]
MHNLRSLFATWGPPRPECAPAWREPLLAQLSQLSLSLLIGTYAQDYHLDGKKTSLTDKVKNWRTYWPNAVPLPHPSPRNNIWLKRNPWFEEELVPVLQKKVRQLLKA